MAELARGTIADRPWGRTLGALGLRGLSGQLTLTADGKRYQIVFARGAVVSAASPVASDAAARIALTGGLVSSTQVADIARRQAAAPARDEIEVIAELVRLGPEQALRLRRRAVAQRAARTFSVIRGEFVVDDQPSLPVVGGTALDIRAVIYLGARQNLSEARLVAELAELGAWFRLRPEAVEDLPQFGFTDAERPVIDRLLTGGSRAELEAANIETRTVHAMLYALVSCNACELDPGARVIPRGPVHAPASPDGAATVRQPRAGSQAEATAAARSRAGGQGEATAGARSRAGSQGDAATVRRSRAGSHGDGAAPPLRSRNTPVETPVIQRRRLPTSRAPAHQRRRADSAHASDVHALIRERLGRLSQGIDHYGLLGVAQDAAPDDIRKAYFGLARQLHPDRLTALGISDETHEAQRLFAHVNTAFALLSDPIRRQEYTDVLRRGGEAAVRAEQARAEELAARIFESEDAFRRGEYALRRDQHTTAITEFTRAVQLNPDEADYLALLAWAQFLASPDKMAIANATRMALDRAILKSPRAMTARFYLGRVERMLGRDQDALKHFHEVLAAEPHHAEAATEARVIESRLAAGGSTDKPGGGLFGRHKR